MTRYLTPSKVALLCLVSVYADGVVPNSATVPILSFLVSHILPPNSSKSLHETSTRPITIQDFEEATISLPSSIPGRTVWDLLLRKIWSIDCCDSLELFFTDISAILTKTREELLWDRDNGIAPEVGGEMKFSRSSPLGAFVRRAQLEFTRLQFHDAVALWRHFVKYRMSTFKAWAKRNPSADAQAAVDVNLMELGIDLTSPLGRVVYGDLEGEGAEEEGFVSTRDVERLLEFQVGEMQRLGGRIPDSMRSQLQKMIASGVTIPSLSHYLRFLDSWRAGDYPSSFDNLHRYFDYTMQNRDRTFYQYALLSLAILQADFGCHTEAVAAIQEAISIARETHDMHCLNFCMSWLYHFGKAFPNEMKDVQNTGMLGSEKEGLAFLKAKAKETEMWSLLSTSLLSEAKLELQSGSSLATAFENIVKASHLNVTKNINNSMGPQLMIQASMYSRIGVMHLAWANGGIFRNCYADQTPIEDYLKITCRSSQLMAQSGDHDNAVALLGSVSPDLLRTLKYQQHWTFFSGLLKLRRQLHRDDKVAAEHLISQLQTNSPPDSEMSLTLLFLSIDLSIRKGDYAAALKTIQKIAQSGQHQAFDVFTQVKLLTLKSRIFDKTGQPQRGFSLAMRAVSVAHRSRLLPALWDAVGVLANILISLREFEAAAEILESIVPQVLECEDCELAARTYSLLVDTNMGLAGEAKQDPVRRKECMTRALEFIDCAFVEFSRIEDVKGQCEIMAKKARIMHKSGDLVLANDYASKYLDLKRQAAAQRLGA
ncbi:anaphase promoting complex subunit 5 [Arachnomyces sp. PD_36]|nr:anaphase promoting complex subunit 5 [Arachnomyces sp. PD_36]